MVNGSWVDSVREENLFENSGGIPGRSICLAVGGAREAFDAIPHKMDLTLKTRKGFVAVAVQAGASIVPVIGF